MQNNSEKYVLQLKNLSVSYGLDAVVSDVSLSMKKGEILCIVGESGSGKSTLIKAIHGLENATVTAGEVVLFGKDCKTKKEKQALMGTEVGLIPQNPGGSFNPLRTFEKQFREALKGTKMAYDENRIGNVFETLGLKDGKSILKSRPYEMSGGMNQRIAIAFSYMKKPKLLLCDEATSALDVTTARIVVEELKTLRKENDTAILMVTHHLGIARTMADNVAIMKDGKIVEYGRAEEIFSNPKCEYTKKLLCDVPKLKIDELE